MARANWRLIEALHTAANSVEVHPKGYDWHYMTSCNVGILARALGVDCELIKRAALPFCDWSTFALKQFMFQPEDTRSGLKVRETLESAGLEPSDLISLEKLSDPAVLERATVESEFGKSVSLVRYYRAWAEILEESTLQETPALATA